MNVLFFRQRRKQRFSEIVSEKAELRSEASSM